MLIELISRLKHLFSDPQKKLVRARKKLVKQLAKKPLSATSEDKATSAYGNVLSFAHACGAKEIVAAVTKFDHHFPATAFGLSENFSLFIQAILSDRDPDVVALEAAWLLSNRIGDTTDAQEEQQRICLELVKLHDTDRLIRKLSARRDTATQKDVTAVLQKYLQNGSFDDNAGWHPYLLSFETQHLPKLHQVFAHISRNAEAARLAEAIGDLGSALEYLWPIEGIDAANQTLTLATTVRDEVSIKKAHNKLAEELCRGGQIEQAADHFVAAGETERASDCYQVIGQNNLAIRFRRDLDPAWVNDIRSAVQSQVQSSLSIGDFAIAVDALRKIQIEWENKGVDPTCEAESKRIGRLLSEAVKMARTAFEAEIKATNAKPGNDVFKRWSILEYSAGNYLEAGLYAEMSLDFFTAALAFEKANAFGQAVSALERASPDPDLLKKAELLEAGGDHYTAGLLYERLNQVDRAIENYRNSGEYGRAADLLRERLQDIKAPYDEDYLYLLTQAERVEELADLAYNLARNDGTPVFERSRLLRRIKEFESKGLIRPQWVEVVESDLAELEVAGRERFDRYAERWFASAISDVRAEYDTTFGLDLGTSNSVVALYNKRQGKAEVAEVLGKKTFPSVVVIGNDGRESVGQIEAEWIGKNPRAVLSKTKRSMGTDKKYKLRDREYRSEEISARIIAHAQKLATEYLVQKVAEKVNNSAFAELGEYPPENFSAAYFAENPLDIEMRRAVITVPAYFNDSQTKATRTAAELANIEVLRLIHEPTAACIAQRFTNDLDETILVVDLGAGTLDLAVVEVASGSFEIIAIEGDTKVGSADIDDLIFHHLLRALLDDHHIDVSAHKLAVRRLRIASEEMKIQLSNHSEWSIVLPALVGAQDAKVSLTRAELEMMASDWLERVVAACKKIVEKPSRVFLIGGGGLTPCVRRCVRDVFALEPGSGIDPLTAVARGAAIQAAILTGSAQDLIVLDVVPFSLGISSFVSPAVSKFDKLIPKHSSFPTSATGRYTTVNDDQNVIKIEVFQGENDVPHLNHKIGQFNLDGIPPAKAGVPSVEVTFSIDANCILTVSARDLGTKRERHIQIADSILLTPAQVSSLTIKYDGERKYRVKLDRLSIAASEIEALTTDVRNMNLLVLGDRVEDHIKYYETNMKRFVPNESDNNTLLEIYRQRDELRNTSVVLSDKLANIFAAHATWLERVVSAEKTGYGNSDASELDELIEEGEFLISKARKVVPASLSVERIYRGWLSVLDGLPVSTGEGAGHLAEHFLRLSKYIEALRHYDNIVEPLSTETVELGLEILSKTRNRDRYEELLSRHAELLGLQPTDFDRLNIAVRSHSSSVVWLHNDLGGGHLATGSGFFISPRLIATNRHVILNTVGDRPVQAGSIRVLTQNTELSISNIRVPSSSRDDIAVLELAHDFADAKPLRLAYSELVEVGERVITIGFPSPDPTSFLENLYCNSGVVNRIKTSHDCSERVLEISIPLHGGISGAPLLNAMGEVIGLVTYSLQRQRTNESGQVDLEKSFYAVPVQILRRLRDELNTS